MTTSNPSPGPVTALMLLLALAGCGTPPDAASADRDPSADFGPIHRVATPVGELAVHDVGRGPQTLVLWSSIFTDHRAHAAQIAHWRSDWRVIAIDGPGHGASGAAPGPFTMAQCAQAVVAIMDARGVQRAVVGGTSWGGLVAGEFALAYPDRTRAVLMLNTPFYKESGATMSDHFITWGARWIHRTQLFTDGVARAFFSPPTRDAAGNGLDWFHTHIQQADGEALQTAVRSVLIEREALAPRLPGITAPALVIAGRQDGMYPLAQMEAAAASLPRGRLVVLETHHISAVDAPDATRQAVDAFLATLPP